MKNDKQFESLEKYLQDLVDATSNLTELLLEPVNALLGNFSGNSRRTEQLPDYRVWGGTQVFKQPYNIQGTEFYGFFVEGTMKNLQDLCDRALNKPDSPVEYRPLTNYILISFDSIDKMSSIDQPDRDEGYFSEKEIIVWVLTVVGKKIGPFFIAERLAWFVPYIFVDNVAALLAGREVYGFPKSIAEVQMPKPEEKPDFFSADTLMLKTFNPDTKAEIRRFLEIKQINCDDDPQVIKIHARLEDIIQQGIELLFGEAGTIEIPGLGFPLKLAEYLIGKEAPTVCLKQIRDVEDGSKACYQAVIELIMQTSSFHTGKLLGFGDSGHQYELNVFKFASQPIIEDLGLQYQFSDSQMVKVPVKLAFYLNFDFIVNNGKIIWENH